ncbi:MAG TPA: hypothetical protein VLB46_04955 [Pyrinomonadaceae bacterium]|nr:hypothetical protein [Pyrinomonadaceae bacterium]
MKRFLAVSLILLGLSSSIHAQEHSTARQSSKVQSTSAKKKTTRRRSSTSRRRSGHTRTAARKRVAPPVVWPAFASTEGRFSVLMPGTPTEKTETIDSEHGPYTTHLFTWREDPLRVYLIGWVDYDPDFDFNRLAEMEANRDNFVQGVSGKLLSSRRSTIDGYPAIEFAAETEEKIFRSRVYIVGRRPYQIVIGSLKGIDDSANVERFFSSFKVSRQN